MYRENTEKQSKKCKFVWVIIGFLYKLPIKRVQISALKIVLFIAISEFAELHILISTTI